MLAMATKLCILHKPIDICDIIYCKRLTSGNIDYAMKYYQLKFEICN